MRAASIACQLVLLASCGTSAAGEMAVKSAAGEARTVAGESFAEFRVVGQHDVLPGSKSNSVVVTLAEGSCYRFIGVRAGASENEVDISFKHPEQMLEKGTDVFDLTPDVWPEGGGGAAWGLCIWPVLAGELKVFHNLSESGGVLLIVEEKAKRLDWQIGEDIKLYLAGTGAIDLEKVEKEQAEAGLMEFFKQDRDAFPLHLSGKNPFYNNMMNTRDPTWDYSFTMKTNTCYHLFMASVNCSLTYEIVNSETGKSVQDDGSPEGVGRRGWSHDFCPTKKSFEKEGTIHIGLQMESHEFDKCWIGVALYSYELSKKEQKKLKVATNKGKKQARLQLKECRLSRTACKKECPDEEKESCEDQCKISYEECVDAVVFHGEMA